MTQINHDLMHEHCDMHMHDDEIECGFCYDTVSIHHVLEIDSRMLCENCQEYFPEEAAAARTASHWRRWLG